MVGNVQGPAFKNFDEILNTEKVDCCRMFFHLFSGWFTFVLAEKADDRWSDYLEQYAKCFAVTGMQEVKQLAAMVVWLLDFVQKF